MKCRRHTTELEKLVPGTVGAGFSDFPIHSGPGLDVLVKRDHANRLHAGRKPSAAIDFEMRLPFLRDLFWTPVSERELVRVPGPFPGSCLPGAAATGQATQKPTTETMGARQ